MRAPSASGLQTTGAMRRMRGAGRQHGGARAKGLQRGTLFCSTKFAKFFEKCWEAAMAKVPGAGVGGRRGGNRVLVSVTLNEN